MKYDRLTAPRDLEFSCYSMNVSPDQQRASSLSTSVAPLPKDFPYDAGMRDN